MPRSDAPRPDLRLVLTDEWSEVYADSNGYLWRPPEYAPRFAVLGQVDPTMYGGWTQIGRWYRSRSADPQYEPSALEKFWQSQLAPGEAAQSTAKTVARYGLAALVIYAVAQIAPAALARKEAT